MEKKKKLTNQSVRQREHNRWNCRFFVFDLMTILLIVAIMGIPVLAGANTIGGEPNGNLWITNGTDAPEGFYDVAMGNQNTEKYFVETNNTGAMQAIQAFADVFRAPDYADVNSKLNFSSDAFVYIYTNDPMQATFANQDDASDQTIKGLAATKINTNASENFFQITQATEELLGGKTFVITNNMKNISEAIVQAIFADTRALKSMQGALANMTDSTFDQPAAMIMHQPAGNTDNPAIIVAGCMDCHENPAGLQVFLNNLDMQICQAVNGILAPNEAVNLTMTDAMNQVLANYTDTPNNPRSYPGILTMACVLKNSFSATSMNPDAAIG